MKRKWWHDKVAYQIYPKSFMDTNGDGIGDLRGVISKLDYLKELGVDIVWLSPIYKSPFVDQGYDIADYYAIAEEFGTMEEFDELLAEAKKRDMYIVMDLVVNHCSSEHEWFKKAMADPEGEYADYFYIREGRDGKEPNNARSYFGGNVWDKVPGTNNKYYLHMFAKEQPDLNWENPIVRERIYEMVRWWLDKGLAGFRIDAIINIKKDLSFPMLEPDGDDGMSMCWNMLGTREEVAVFLQELKHETFDKYDAFTVGEVFNIEDEDIPSFIGEEGHFSTMFDFSAHMLSMSGNGWYDTPPVKFQDFKRAVLQSQMRVKDIGFEANIIENHDESRGASRYLPAYARNPMGAKMLGTVSILLRGIPFIFQGQEIGMQNAKWNSVDEFDDINTKDQYKVALEAGLAPWEALERISPMSRDNARTPVQWSAEKNAGFTTGTPWLKVNENYKEINVEAQEKDPDSVLNYYRKLIALRKSEEYGEVFTYGDVKPILEERDNIMGYTREGDGKKIVVIANFGGEDETITLESVPKKVMLSNMGRTDIGKTVRVASCEVMVLEM